MTEAKRANHWGLMAVVLALQVWLGLLAAGIYISSHNSLYNNGNWTPTKTTLAGDIMGAFNYYFNLQALAAERLGLSAWHGHQEVVLNPQVDPAVIEFDYLLKNKGHLTFQFNRTDRRFAGIRLSASELFPPVLVQGTAEGRFLKKRPFDELPTTAEPRWRRLRVELGDDRGVVVFCDGHRVRTFRMGVVRPQRIGFRGSFAGTYVDNVRIVSRDGSVLFDDFSRPANWRVAKLAGVAGVPLVGLALCLLLRRLLPISEKYLLFYFLMFTLLLLVLGGMWQGISWHQKKYYPNATEKLRRFEAAHIETGTEKMVARIESEHSIEPPPGVVRILFLGSSQTRGSGASTPEQTLVRWTERLLNKQASERRFECLNGAVRGYRIAQMARDFAERWVDWNPDVVILNVGNNDQGTPRESWLEAQRTVVDTARAAGMRPVLVLEPNSIERRGKRLLQLHKMTLDYGRRMEVPVVDMQTHLQERHDDGFLWWDWVHLTSFGQRVFAEYLVDELIRQGVVELAG